RSAGAAFVGRPRPAASCPSSIESAVVRSPDRRRTRSGGVYAADGGRKRRPGVSPLRRNALLERRSSAGHGRPLRVRLRSKVPWYAAPIGDEHEAAAFTLPMEAE